MDTLPSIFVSHGAPTIAVDPREAGRFLQRLGPVIDAAFGRPRAIVVVSAHSLTREPAVLAAPRLTAVHDFSGFDPALYELRYDAPGAPALADRVAALLLEGAGMRVHRLEDDNGIDHGVWTPLRYLYPDADVPLLPLMWPPSWSPARLHALGQALAPLAAEGVLLLASGSITHNLRRAFAGGRDDVGRAASADSTAFRDWFADRAAAADWPALFDYRAQAPHAVAMHPSDEHLLPWFVAAGAGDGAPGLRLHASTTFGEIGMDAYAFGAGAGRLAAALEPGRATA